MTVCILKHAASVAGVDLNQRGRVSLYCATARRVDSHMCVFSKSARACGRCAWSMWCGGAGPVARFRSWVLGLRPVTRPQFRLVDSPWVESRSDSVGRRARRVQVTSFTNTFRCTQSGKLKVKAELLKLRGAGP